MAIDDNTSYELTGYQVKDLAQKIRAKADSSSLASVATSGLYSDLTGAPTIPTVYNGTLTIQQNGTTLGTFSANQSTNETINITGGSGDAIKTFYIADTLENLSGSRFPIYTDGSLTQSIGYREFAVFAKKQPIKLIHDDAIGFFSYDVSIWHDEDTLYSQTVDGAYYYAIGGSNAVDAKIYKFQFSNDSGANISKIIDIQPKLTAGTGISIDANNVISATGGGGGTTTFYQTKVGGFARFYSDSAMTQLVTGQDIADAVAAGTVYFSTGLGELLTVISCFPQYNPGEYLFAVTNSNLMITYVPTSTTEYFESVYTIQEELTAGSNISISGNTISATDTTYSDFTGASSSTAGANGLVPAPAAGDQEKVLHGDGTWKDTTAKLVEMSYGESNAWAKFIAAYNAGSIVYCRASSNANPATGSQTRKAFMAYVNNATNPTSVEFQYVRSVSSKTEAQPVDQVFVYTLTNTNGGTWSVASRNMGPKIVAGAGINVSYSNGTYTISLA